MNEKEKDRIIISREKKAHVASKYYYMPTKGSLQILLRGQKKKNSEKVVGTKRY